MRRMGIDPGSRRTGLAVSEPGLGVACPHRTVEHASQAAAIERVCDAAREVGAEELVVGLPLRLDGSEGEAARRARRFAGSLTERLGIPAILWDERLSTAAAERALDAQGVRGSSRRQVVDQAAAALILQSYLDAHRPVAALSEETELEMPELPPAPPAARGRRRRGRR